MSKKSSEELFLDFIQRDDFPLSVGTMKSNSFRSLIDGYVNIYYYFCLLRTDMTYSELEGKYLKNSRRIFHLYKPTLDTELGPKGELEINVINKKMEVTGKRTSIKVGRFLTIAYPFLSDATKEAISTWVKDNYTPLDVNIVLTEQNFGDVCVMQEAKGASFDTNRMHKSLSNSCMRYTKKDFGFDKHHPYDAYCSGDFILLYLEKDDKLYGRVLLHKDSKTHSAFYGVSKPAINKLQEAVKQLKFIPVDNEYCSEWKGAKLLHLEDYVTPEDDCEYEGACLIVPYVDFLDDEEGWTDGQYIYINHRPYDGMNRVDLQMAEGYNEW